MLKHTKRQVNEFCFPKCVLLSCLSPQFVCHFLLSYDDQRKRVFTKQLSATCKITECYCENTQPAVLSSGLTSLEGVNGVNRLATKGEKILLTTDKTRKKIPTTDKDRKFKPRTEKVMKY